MGARGHSSFVNACGHSQIFFFIALKIPPLSQRPFLWSAGGAASGLCGPAAASSAPADVYRLSTCKYILQLKLFKPQVLFEVIMRRRFLEKSSTCKTVSLPELQPHLELLSLPQGRDVGWSVFLSLSWLKSFFHDAWQEWRVLRGRGLVITFFSCLLFPESILHSKQMVFMTQFSHVISPPVTFHIFELREHTPPPLRPSRPHTKPHSDSLYPDCYSDLHQIAKLHTLLNLSHINLSDLFLSRSMSYSRGN